MNFRMGKKVFSGLLFFLSLNILYLSSNYFVHSSIAEEKVKGVKLSKSGEKKYQTSLGQLNNGFLLQNDNQVSMDKSGNLLIVFGFIHMGSDEAVEIDNNVAVFQGETNLSPHITFVQDQKNGKWLATNGTMCIQNNSNLLLDNTTIKVIGGTDKPIKIAGQPFADTTVLIKNGRPIVMK